MPAIEIRNLSFSYQNGKQNIQALNGLNLTVKDGEFLCIIGPSGGGKSTLLRMLAGLETPDEGAVLIDGKAVTGPGSDRMIVFQDYALFPWFTVEKNVSFALRQGRGLSKQEAKEKTRVYLERVGMCGTETMYPFQLSGGMRQRVAIARALAMDTDILLLDEPFGALDAKIRTEIQKLLLTLWRNEGGNRKTVVFVTHDVNEAILLADRIVFMEPGKVRTEVNVDLPRPRENCEELRQKLLALFEEAKV